VVGEIRTGEGEGGRGGRCAKASEEREERESVGGGFQVFHFVGLSYMLVVIIRHEDSLFSKINYGFITDQKRADGKTD
jgi:hypothetical protein